MCKRLAATLLNPLTLTPREADVLRLLCIGYSDKAIGCALDISDRTVGRHLQAIYQKLKVSQTDGNSRGLTAGLAVAGGLVKLQIGQGNRRHGRDGDRRLKAGR